MKLRKRFSALVLTLCMMLTLAPSALADSADGNDTQNTATAISLNSPLTGNLSSSKDVDFYKFTLTQNDVISLVFGFNESNPYMRLSLRDGSTNEELNYWDLTSDNQAYPFSASRYNLPAGDYYIKISGFMSASNADYTITAKAEFGGNGTPADRETEWNDTANTADVLPLNTTVTGNLSNSKDVDFYKFTLTQTEKVSFVFGFASSNPYMRLALRNAEKELDYWDMTSDSRVYPYTTDAIELTAGDYYVKISGFMSASNADYSVNAKTAGGSTPAPTPTPTPTPPPSSGNAIGGFTGESITVGVKLWWQSQSGGLGYRVYRSESSGNPGISTTDFYITSNEFVDVNVDGGKTYYYTVRQVLKEARPFEGLAEELGPVSASIKVTTAATILGGDSSSTSRTKNFILMTMDDPNMSVNGVRQEIDPGRGTTPMVKNNRTLVPIRAIVEAMGGTVGWDQSAQRIDLKNGSSSVVMTVGSKAIQVDGVSKSMDVVPEVMNNRTYVPIRFSAENLGCVVDWLNSTRQVVIVYYS